jgi:hypothetical protein
MAPGVNNNDARHHLSLNTCNGCHGKETNTTFVQIFPRFPGLESSLSPFLSGTTVIDPVSKVRRVFNDLKRRKLDMQGIVCPSTASRTSVAKGIRRVH